MTLFLNTRDKRIYTLEDHGIYGYYAYMYKFTHRVIHVNHEDLNNFFKPIAII